MMSSRTIPAALIALLLASLGSPIAQPAQAWTPEMHAEIARQAATVAPPDLLRQIRRHEKAFAAGLSASLGGRSHSDSGEALLSRVRSGSETIAASIQSYRPLSEIVHDLGRLAAYAAEANNPLRHSAADPDEARYQRDYEDYVGSAFSRFQVVFYGQGRDIRTASALEQLLSHTEERSVELYPLVGREYRRIGTIDGAGQFDDKSTAFGIGSLAFSHAVSDLAAIYRYIWLRSGGDDQRDLPLTEPQPAGRAR